jgi:hypothetical protein
MNANELADELDKSRQEPFTSEYLVGQAAAMLSQQAEEIIELECEKERQREKYEGMLCDRDVEIEALKAGKIRAYDNGVEDGRKPNTHPAKTLTDEEIYEVWCDAIKEEAIVNKGKPPILKYQPFVFFARAILKKAQEK